MKRIMLSLLLSTVVCTPAAVQPIFEYVKTPDEAYDWEQSDNAKTGENDWLLLFPMTKVVVRAMDAVEEYAAEAWETPVWKFC